MTPTSPNGRWTVGEVDTLRVTFGPKITWNCAGAHGGRVSPSPGSSDDAGGGSADDAGAGRADDAGAGRADDATEDDATADEGTAMIPERAAAEPGAAHPPSMITPAIPTTPAAVAATDATFP